MISFCFSAESLRLPDRDPTGLAVGREGYSVVATKQEVVVSHNMQRVSSFTPSFEPCASGFHPSENEVAIGGKVSEGVRV